MKKIICIAAALVLLSGCSMSEKTVSVNINTPSDAWMKAAARSAVDGLRSCAQDETLINIYSTAAEINNIILEWSELDVDTSKDIVRIRHDEAAIEDYFEKQLESDETAVLSELGDAARKYLELSYSQSFINTINAGSGVTQLAASAIIRYTKSYVVGESVVNQTWLLECDDELAIGVSFTNTGDNVITVSAAYVAPQEGVESLINSILAGSSSDTAGSLSGSEKAAGAEENQTGAVDTLKW